MVRPHAKSRSNMEYPGYCPDGHPSGTCRGSSYVEAQLPALPIPGAKLGLANIVSMITLYLLGLKEAVLLTVLRQTVGSVFTGTILAPTFFFGLAGGVLSVLVMAAVRAGLPVVGPITVSLLGAVTHNTGQLLVAWVVTGSAAVLYYLPYLLECSRKFFAPAMAGVFLLLTFGFTSTNRQ